MVYFFVVFSITHFRFNQKIFTQILDLCINNTAPHFYQLSTLNVLTNFWFSNFLLACDATGRLLVEGGPLVIGFKETIVIVMVVPTPLVEIPAYIFIDILI